MGSIGSHWSQLVASLSQQATPTDEDDVAESTASLLSMLRAASVLVSKDEQVVRASPDAYRLSIVDQDRLADEQVRQAVHQAGSSGTISRFSLTTQTAPTFADVPSAQTSAEQDGAGFADEFELEPDDGHLTGDLSRPNWLQITVGPLSDTLVLVLIEDVSEAKRFEQTREAFIEHVSSQLLGPIRSLEQLARSLEDVALSPLDDLELVSSQMDRIDKDAHQLKAYSGYLEHTLADLLLLMRAQKRVEATQNNLVDIDTEVGSVVQALGPKAHDCEVELTYQGQAGLTTHGDAGQIRVAVTKLVENAIRYSPPASTVSLVAQASQDGAFAVIRVIDRGQGIRPADQEHIFERFYRGQNQTEESQVGIGLGLAIVKHVALTHHGSVSLWSQPGQGSTFTLMLPRDQGQHQ